jgi:hypothetical protein
MVNDRQPESNRAHSRGNEHQVITAVDNRPRRR